MIDVNSRTMSENGSVDAFGLLINKKSLLLCWHEGLAIAILNADLILRLILLRPTALAIFLVTIIPTLTIEEMV